MSEAQIIGLGVAISMSLIGAVWVLVRQEAKRHADAIEKRATITALDEAKETHREEIKDLRSFFQSQLAEVNRRQDREIDMINTSINRVDHGVAELRKEMTSANARISQGLQDVLSSVQRGRRSE